MKKRRFARVLPSPVLSIALWVLWLLLNQSVSPGVMLLGAVLAVVLPLGSHSLRPTQPHVHRPMAAVRLLGIVMHDMVVSACQTFWLLVTRRSQGIESGFVRVPLDLHDPHALAVLAMICTLTPGTAWAEVALDRSALLVHVLDARHPDAFIALMKQRYERPLMEIFE